MFHKRNKLKGEIAYLLLKSMKDVQLFRIYG